MFPGERLNEFVEDLIWLPQELALPLSKDTPAIRIRTRVPVTSAEKPPE